MTKAEIVDRIAEKMSFTKDESFEIVELVLETLKATLEKGENFKITGFGNFVVKKKSERRARNPQTGEAITIEARHILTFKPSAVLKQSINELSFK